MNFKLKKRGCVPNLRGTSPIVCDVGGYSYAARANSRGEHNQATSQAQGSPRCGKRWARGVAKGAPRAGSKAGARDGRGMAKEST